MSTLKESFANIQRTHSENYQRTFRAHSKKAQRKPREHPENTHRTPGEHPENTLEELSEYIQSKKAQTTSKEHPENTYRTLRERSPHLRRVPSSAGRHFYTFTGGVPITYSGTDPDDGDDRTLCDGKCARVICRVVSRWSDDEISTSSSLPAASRCLLGMSKASAYKENRRKLDFFRRLDKVICRKKGGKQTVQASRWSHSKGGTNHQVSRLSFIQQIAMRRKKRESVLFGQVVDR